MSHLSFRVLGQESTYTAKCLPKGIGKVKSPLVGSKAIILWLLRVAALSTSNADEDLFAVNLLAGDNVLLDGRTVEKIVPRMVEPLPTSAGIAHVDLTISAYCMALTWMAHCALAVYIPSVSFRRVPTN